MNLSADISIPCRMSGCFCSARAVCGVLLEIEMGSMPQKRGGADACAVSRLK